VIIVYGIKNCDTVKKALKWLAAAGIDHRFHDFRKDGLTRDQLSGWLDELGGDALLNRRGTTWRKLPDDQKENLSDGDICDLLLAHPAMIKRPLFDFGDFRRVGFASKDQAEIAALLGVAA